MKDLFPGYYRPTDEELSKLWKDCFFAFDANVLLNLYRYSENSTKDFLETLSLLSKLKRLWIPHQAALEYHRGRLQVIGDQKKKYIELIDFLNSNQKIIDDKMGQFNRHPYIKTDDLFSQISESFRNIINDIEKLQKNHPDLLQNDTIRDNLVDILSGNIGNPYTQTHLDEIYTAGKKRYDQEIPPGFKDDQKEGNRKYGDLVMWNQILERAKEKDQPFIFVTDDRKEDWWLRYEGKTISPRPELIEEFYSYCKKGFYIYQADNFTEYAKRYIRKEVDQNTIEEIRTIRNDDEKLIEATKSLRQKIFESSSYQKIDPLSLKQILAQSSFAAREMELLKTIPDFRGSTRYLDEIIKQNEFITKTAKDQLGLFNLLNSDIANLNSYQKYLDIQTENEYLRMLRSQNSADIEPPKEADPYEEAPNKKKP